MLFSADAQDPIVRLLIGTSLSFNSEELAEMAVCGELREETDRKISGAITFFYRVVNHIDLDEGLCGLA